MKKAMVTKKEKALLLYMYGLAEDLHEFIIQNGYTIDDFDHCTIHIDIAEEKDLVEASFCTFYPSRHAKRSLTLYAVGDHKPEYEEHKWRDENDENG